MGRSLEVGRSGAPRMSALVTPVLVLLGVMGLADRGVLGHVTCNLVAYGTRGQRLLGVDSAPLL